MISEAAACSLGPLAVSPMAGVEYLMLKCLSKKPAQLALARDQSEEGTGDRAQYTTGTPVFNSLLPDRSVNGYCIDDARTFKIQSPPKGQAIATGSE